MKKYIFIVLACILAAAGYFYQFEPFSPVRIELIAEKLPPLRMGVIPYLPTDELKKEFQPVIDYLQLKIKRPVILNVAADYKSLARLLEQGKIHIAGFSHGSYELLKGENKWEILCRPVQRQEVFHRGRIIAKANSGIKNLSDLKGRTFAYVDKYSGSGFVFPNRLLQKQDISPLRDFSEIFFTLSHEASVKGVLEGKYDAAAVYDNAPLLLSELANKSLIAIADTEAIPTDPMVVSSDLEAPLKASLQSAMTNMHNDEEGKKLLALLYESRGIERYITEAEVQEIIRLRDGE